MDKDVKKFADSLVSLPGVSLEHGGKHLRVLLDGQLVSTIPTTPSDHRWRANTVAQLRAKGLTPPSTDRKARKRTNAGAEAPVPWLRPEQVEGVRAELRHLVERRQIAAFARFLTESRQAAGRPPLFKDAASAAAALRASARGGGIREAVALGVREALPHFREWQAQQEKARETERRKVAPPAPPSAGRTVVVKVDLWRLNEFLAPLGIRVEEGS